jgi:mRNA interferase MazF
VPPPYVPDRGDFVWIDFDPQAGREQAGRRPGLVLSPKMYNAPAGLALICPITSRTKGYPYEVPLPAGLAVSGVVLADHVKSMDWSARRAVFIAAAPVAVVDDVLAKVASLIT